MLTPVLAKSFTRDLKRVVCRGRDPHKIAKIIDLLCAQKPLPHSLRDHALKGKWIGHRDCHIEPDLVMVYRIVQDRLLLICVHIGSHADLFGN